MILISRYRACTHRSHRRTGADLFDGSPTSLEHIKAGKLRALAVTSATRSEVLSDVPILSDFLPD